MTTWTLVLLKQILTTATNNDNNTPFTGLKTSRNFNPDYGEHVKGGKLRTLWTLGILPKGIATALTMTSAMTPILHCHRHKLNLSKEAHWGLL